MAWYALTIHEPRAPLFDARRVGARVFITLSRGPRGAARFSFDDCGWPP